MVEVMGGLGLVALSLMVLVILLLCLFLALLCDGLLSLCFLLYVLFLGGYPSCQFEDQDAGPKFSREHGHLGTMENNVVYEFSSQVDR